MNEPDCVLGIEIGGVKTLVFVTHPYDDDGWTCLSWSDMLGYGQLIPMACYNYPRLSRPAVEVLIETYIREYYVKRKIIPVDSLEHEHNQVRKERAMLWQNPVEI